MTERYQHKLLSTCDTRRERFFLWKVQNFCLTATQQNILITIKIMHRILFGIYPNPITKAEVQKPMHLYP